MNESELAENLALLDGRGTDREWAAVQRLRDELGDRLPDILLEHFKLSRAAGVRASCVYHSLKHARSSDAAIELGKLALKDRANAVRYRGSMLLAYSLRKELLPFLRELASSRDGDKSDILAAIDAIEHSNHHYFVDREHTGKLTLQVR